MPPLPRLTGWRRRAAYGAFFGVAFVFALQQTFPAEAVRERVVLEAAARGWEVRFGDIAPAGFAGVRASAVVLESRAGLKVPLDEVRASLRLWPLVLGRRGVRFEASLAEGRVSGLAEEGRGRRRLALDARGLELSRSAALRQATGLDLAGALSGDVELTLDDREPAKSSGRLVLEVEGAVLNGGELPVPGMGGGTLTLPRVALGRVSARGTVKDGRALFETLQARGGDVELTGQQVSFPAQANLELAPLSGRLRVAVSEAYWERSGTTGLRGVVEMALAGARGSDGSFGFQLQGTVGRPQASPAAAP